MHQKSSIKIIFIVLISFLWSSAGAQPGSSDGERAYFQLMPNRSSTYMTGPFCLSNDLSKDIFISNMHLVATNTWSVEPIIPSRFPMYDVKAPFVFTGIPQQNQFGMSSLGEYSGNLFIHKRILKNSALTFNTCGYINQGNVVEKSSNRLLLPRKTFLCVNPIYSFQKVYNRTLDKKFMLQFRPIWVYERSYIGQLKINPLETPVMPGVLTVFTNRTLAAADLITEYQPATGFKFIVGLQGKKYRENGWWGNKNYEADQQSFLGEVKIKRNIKNREWETGLQLRNDQIAEKLDDIGYTRNERVAGIYGRLSDKPQSWKKFNYQAQLRADYHNLFGWLFAPALRINKEIRENSYVGIYSTMGNSPANPISYGRNLLLGNRELKFLPKAFAEKYIESGMAIQYRKYGPYSFSGTLHYIYYTDRLVADITHNQVSFYHGTGNDIRLQGQLSTGKLDRVGEFNLGLQYQHIQWRYEGKTLPAWYMPSFQALLSYSGQLEKWFSRYSRPWVKLNVVQVLMADVYMVNRQGEAIHLPFAPVTDVNISRDFHWHHYHYHRTNYIFHIAAGVSNLFNKQVGSPYSAATNTENYTGPQYTAPLAGRRFVISVKFAVSRYR